MAYFDGNQAQKDRIILVKAYRVMEMAGKKKIKQQRKDRIIYKHIFDEYKEIFGKDSTWSISVTEAFIGIHKNGRRGKERK